MNAQRIALGIVGALCIALGLTACQAAWSPKLADVDESRWLNSDRVKLFTDSPWVRHARVPVSGFIGKTQVMLDVSASWESPFLQGARRVMLPKLEAEIPYLLSFDPSLESDSARFRGPVVAAVEPPPGISHGTLIVSPLLADGLGFWPTSIRQAMDAHRQLGIVPPQAALIKRELDGYTPLSDVIAIELTIVPIILRHEPRPGDQDLDQCIARLIGQMLLRGASLIRADQAVRSPQHAIILSHDIDHHWELAAWKMTDEGLVIAAPVVARLLFVRNDGETSWLNEQQDGVTLELAAPRAAAGQCAKNPDEGLDSRIQIDFSFTAMRVVGSQGV